MIRHTDVMRIRAVTIALFCGVAESTGTPWLCWRADVGSLRQWSSYSIETPPVCQAGEQNFTGTKPKVQTCSDLAHAFGEMAPTPDASGDIFFFRPRSSIVCKNDVNQS